MSSGQTSLEQMLGVYKWVVDDVMKNVREDFLNEGADTQVLEDLKQLWENKLVQSGALSRPVKPAEPPHPPKETNSSHEKQQQQHKTHQLHQTSSQTSSAPPPTTTTTASVIQQAPPRSSPSSAMTTPTTSATTSLGLPPPPLLVTTQTQASESGSEATPPQTTPQIMNAGGAGTSPSFLNMALQQAALYSAIAGGGANPVGGAGTALQPVMLPGGGLSLVQHGGIPYAAVRTPTGLQYVPIALNLPATLPSASTETSGTTDITQLDGPLPVVDKSANKHKTSSNEESVDGESVSSSNGVTHSNFTEESLPVISFDLPPGMTPSCLFPAVTSKSSSSSKRKPQCRSSHQHNIPQLDGPPPPPDASSSEESDESSDSDPDDIEGEQDDNDDPLNSADDAESDEEDDVWETDNTIVCQFEKVYRVRAKWKFALKDGIMHLNGHDYIFTKTTGEAEW